MYVSLLGPDSGVVQKEMLAAGFSLAFQGWLVASDGMAGSFWEISQVLLPSFSQEYLNLTDVWKTSGTLVAHTLKSNAAYESHAMRCLPVGRASGLFVDSAFAFGGSAAFDFFFFTGRATCSCKMISHQYHNQWTMSKTRLFIKQAIKSLPKNGRLITFR